MRDDYSHDDFVFDVKFWLTGAVVLIIGGAFMAHCSGIL